MKKNNVSNFLLKSLLFIVLVIVTAILINYFMNDSPLDNPSNLDPDATDEQEIADGDSNDEIAIPGFDKLVFEENALTQDVAFENPEQNDVYFIFSLALEDEVIYESQLIEPGKGIYSIELPTAYEAGEYSGQLSYETRSMNDPNEAKNGAAINIPIVVE